MAAVQITHPELTRHLALSQKISDVKHLVVNLILLVTYLADVIAGVAVSTLCTDVLPV